MDYYSFNRPRRDGRLSRPCWLTEPELPGRRLSVMISLVAAVAFTGAHLEQLGATPSTFELLCVRFTHKEVTRPAASLAQDRESTPAEPAVLTTMLRHQPVHQDDVQLAHVADRAPDFRFRCCSWRWSEWRDSSR